MAFVNSTIESVKSKYLHHPPPVLRTPACRQAGLPPQRGGEDVFEGGFINPLDLDLLIAHVIKKEREFILIHPEYILNKNQELRIKNYVQRRLKNEPLAYILGEKEFYGLNFKVNRHTLIPRPETELMVEIAMEFIKTNEHEGMGAKEHENIKTLSVCVIPEVSISEKAKRFHGNTTIRDLKEENRSRISDFLTAHSSQEKSTSWDDTAVVDVGTGSGNIVISILKNLIIDSKFEIRNSKFFGLDFSENALKIAKQNAKLNKVNKNIKFLHGNLLSPLNHNSRFKIHNSKILILANLPYLSKDIYAACALNVKKYEPKSALYSANDGLAHYEKLFFQIKKILQNTKYKIQNTILMEISPEQKKPLPPLIKKYFPQAKIEFKKDLAEKWRVCKIEIK